MINIKNLTIKNFMSVGNVTQAINFDQNKLTLVLGENLDVGDNGSRNGSGKTTIINALSYALYGSALTNIKRDNLINKTNAKNMLVSVDFSINDNHYRIERGRRPTILRFFKNSTELQSDDESQGDNRETQHTIEELLGISHEIFKHTIALNTYTEPFLSMRIGDQRMIIEELLGITILTEKSIVLKELNKKTKNEIKEEEFKIKATKQANNHIEEQIKNLKRRQQIWESNREENLENMALEVQQLLDLNIDDEISAHHALEKYNITKAKIDECNKWITQIDKNVIRIEKQITNLQSDLNLLENNVCYACGQKIHDEKQTEIKSVKLKKIEEYKSQLKSNQLQKDQYLIELEKIGELLEKPITVYKTLNEVYDHKNKLDQITHRLENMLEETDPYEDQIKELTSKGLQEIKFNTLNDLKNLYDHQTFLLNLLTNKDSFIRKRIIEQNLNYLNSRLTYYLSEMGLPHVVKFLSDLSVEITDLGRDLDFDNLSRGERNRLILSLSWAFRDVWESFYNHINVLFVDELIDSGLDITGVENAVHILKHMVRTQNKSIWLISHRDELISRVSNSMKVIKESGFTTYETND